MDGLLHALEGVAHEASAAAGLPVPVLLAQTSPMRPHVATMWHVLAGLKHVLTPHVLGMRCPHMSMACAGWLHCACMHNAMCGPTHLAGTAQPLSHSRHSGQSRCRCTRTTAPTSASEQQRTRTIRGPSSCRALALALQAAHQTPAALPASTRRIARQRRSVQTTP